MTISAVVKSKLQLKRVNCAVNFARYYQLVFSYKPCLKYALPEVDRAWPAMDRLHIAVRVIVGPPGIFKSEGLLTSHAPCFNQSAIRTSWLSAY